MRRLSGGTRGMAGAFSALEQFYAPANARARQEIEEQRHIGRPAPAPTDPPDLDPVPDAPAGGPPPVRFRGRITVRRPEG